MCRKKDRPAGGCVLLDADTSKWNKSALLPQQSAVTSGVEHLARAVRLAAEGRTADAQAELLLIDGDGIRDWFIKHAQVAGLRRVEILGRKREERVVGSRAKLKYPRPELEAKIFARDGYKCGYCGGRVISGRLLQLFAAAIGPAYLPMGRTNLSTHGAALAYRAVADHVVPHWCGGATDEANLVTACYPCNFGKAEFSRAQLGLEEPRPVVTDGWDGLESLAPALQRRAAVNTRAS